MALANTIRRSEVVCTTPPDTDELSLIQSAQARDEVALQVLLKRYKWSITGIAKRMLRDAPEAEVDGIVNKVREKVWTQIEKFHVENTFSAWIKKITVRLCLTELRRRKLNAYRMVPFEDNSGGEEFEPWRDNAERAIEIARQVFAHCKRNHQRLIDLVCWQGQKISDVARMTGKSEEHVRYVIRSFQDKARDAVKRLLPGQRLVMRANVKKA